MPKTPLERPPFWQYAAKAAFALAVGVVVAGGTITAAVADERVTPSEWVAIVLAVLGAVVGPTGVYALRNRTPAEHAAAKARARVLASAPDPWHPPTGPT